MNFPNLYSLFCVWTFREAFSCTVESMPRQQLLKFLATVSRKARPRVEESELMGKGWSLQWCRKEKAVDSDKSLKQIPKYPQKKKKKKSTAFYLFKVLDLNFDELERISSSLDHKAHFISEYKLRSFSKDWVQHRLEEYWNTGLNP